MSLICGVLAGFIVIGIAVIITTIDDKRGP